MPAQWWRAFGSDKINVLVDMAFAQNPSVGEAIAALEQAKWNVRAQEGAFFPQITGEWASTRQKLPAPEGAPSRFKGEIFTLHTPQVNVGFLPDVWGKNRRAVEALMSVADAQYYELEATYLTLAANTVVAVIQQASFADQIAATRDIVNINKRILGILDKEFKAGSASGLDVASQEAQLAQAQSLLPPLEKAYAQQTNLIAALTGNFPADANWAPTSLGALRLERQLPLIVPSELVDQRPDVRAAEAQVHAASAEIGVATANLLPQFGITGDVGASAQKLSELFTPQSLVWSITGSVMQPIFKGGTLLAQKRAAEAAFLEAASAYRATVITAVQNVADVLREIEADNRAIRAAEAYEKAAEKALNMVETELRAGQVAISVLLTSQQNYQQSRLAVIQARDGKREAVPLLALALSAHAPVRICTDHVGWPTLSLLRSDDRRRSAMDCELRIRSLPRFAERRAGRVPGISVRKRLVVAALLAATLTVGACGESNTYVPPPPPTVDVAFPVKQTVEQYLLSTGSTAAVNSTTLVARIPGFIQAINYKDGDAVKAGTVLFVIEQKPYQLALEQAEAGQASAVASTKQAEADYARQSELAAQKISSQATLDQSTASKESAIAKQKQAEVDVEQAQLNLNYAEVKAPFDGIVTAREVSLGQYVGAGSATALATIVQLNPIYVNFSVSETEVQRIRADFQARGVTPEDLKKTPIEVGLQTEAGFPHRGKRLIES